MPLSPQTRDKLKTVSTATICTALYKRGFRNQFIQDVHPLNPNGAPMVGEAFTLRYIPAREDLNPLTVFQDRAHLPIRSARRSRSARRAQQRVGKRGPIGTERSQSLRGSGHSGRSPSLGGRSLRPSSTANATRSGLH